MANHKSAAKRARQSVKHNERNRARRAQILTLSKAAQKAAEGKNKEEAAVALRAAESALARAAQRGTMHPKTAARKTSRLAKRVKKAVKS